MDTLTKAKVRFALIGCGRISQRHTEQIVRLAELVAVCDVKIDRAKEIGNKYGCKCYSDFAEMLSQESSVDVVAVCTPNAYHSDHSVMAMRAGKHVLCEKPMATSVKDCGRMIYESEKCNRRLLVIKQNRFNPPIQALKKAIDDGRLGRIFNIQVNCFWNRGAQYYRDSDWKGKRALDGGTLFTQFSHFVDLLYWMFGDISSVSAITRNFLHKDTVEFEDTGAVLLEFESGAIGTMNYTVNSFGKNMEGSLTVFGEKGTVKVGGQYLNILEYQAMDGYAISGLANSSPANDYGYYQGSMSNHDKVYENAIEVLVNNQVIATAGYEGLKTVEIIERIYRAANI